jgi:hypothetical protein
VRVPQAVQPDHRHSLITEGLTAAIAPLDADGWLAYVARRVNFTITVRDSPRLVAPPSYLQISSQGHAADGAAEIADRVILHELLQRERFTVNLRDG